MEIDWYNDKDVVAMLLMDAALHLIGARMWREFGRLAIGFRERAGLEAFLKKERDDLVRCNEIYAELPRLHVNWDSPSAPKLYFQKMTDETAQALAEMIVRP